MIQKGQVNKVAKNIVRLYPYATWNPNTCRLTNDGYYGAYKIVGSSIYK